MTYIPDKRVPTIEGMDWTNIPEPDPELRRITQRWASRCLPDTQVIDERVPFDAEFFAYLERRRRREP